MITIRGNIDKRAVEQMQRCADSGDTLGAAICADGHVGYSQPIGGVIAYRDQISPSGVGYDIACGNKSVKTNLEYNDLHTYMPEIMDEIVARISFGMGRINDEPVDHPVLDAIAEANFEPQRNLIDSARRQLGTVGSGNHYVDLFRDEEDWVWIGVHFGSRGFGHKTANGFLAMAEEEKRRRRLGREANANGEWGTPRGRLSLWFNKHAKDGEMDSPPILLSTNSELGQSYIEAMTLAGAYASAGREVVVSKVLEILGATSTFEVHNHHNFAWLEEHQGEKVWVIRKGCTPAWPGQQGFVGATMGEDSVILEGIESSDMPTLFYSTVHGAGRVMSRTQAAGKTKRRKFWECQDCDYTTRDGKQPCSNHGHERMVKRWSSELVKPGQIDFDAVKDDLRDRGIELRGAAADEAPGAYKRLDQVLTAHEGTIRILHRLTPIGVAMAGPDIYDPFKD